MIRSRRDRKGDAEGAKITILSSYRSAIFVTSLRTLREPGHGCL